MRFSEMTMRGPDLSKQAQDFVDKYQDHWKKHGKYIADIEKYRVLQDRIYYSLWNNDEQIIAAVALYNADNTVDDAWVHPAYRNQKIFSKILWFFKTRLNKTPLLLGQVHSNIMQEVIKGLSRFEKNWFNVRTLEKKPFSLETLDDFYSWGQVTPWRLMLENAGDFSEWPMFSGQGFVLETYEGYID